MLTAILGWFTSRVTVFLPWILGIGAAGLAYFGLTKAGENEAYAQIAKQQLLQSNQALTITQAVSALSDADVTARLHEQFSAS